MRLTKSYPISVPDFKSKLLAYANGFERVCYLDSNEAPPKSSPKGRTSHHTSSSECDGSSLSLGKGRGWASCLVAVGCTDEIVADYQIPSAGRGKREDGREVGENHLRSSNSNVFESLKSFYDKKKDWLFGFVSYDAKNDIENLSSENPDFIGFPILHFFQPKYVFEIKEKEVHIHYLPEHTTEEEVEGVYNQILTSSKTEDGRRKTEGVLPSSVFGLRSSVSNRISKEEYLLTIEKIRQHIKLGDCYELNYCQEFYAENIEIEPLQIYEQLNKYSPAPFSCYYKLKDNYLLCASPERFLQKTGNEIISQPIKGTSKRGKTKEEDEQLKSQLFNDPKERAENVMIVDLVRNDLSRVAKPATVEVKELFVIYSFPQVHQMISTVAATVREDVHCIDVIKNAFPMGSMTGAPKVKVMQLIEQYEKTKRGLYSGTVGYITPQGDFDFNVVIRSILYNADSRYLSFMTGGAITYNSIAENEYEECLLKAKGMMEVLMKK